MNRIFSIESLNGIFLFTSICLYWQPAGKILLLSETLTSLGIMGTQFRATLKPRGTILSFDVRGASGEPQLSPFDAERRKSIGRLAVVVFPILARQLIRDQFFFFWRTISSLFLFLTNWSKYFLLFDHFFFLMKFFCLHL